MIFPKEHVKRDQCQHLRDEQEKYTKEEIKEGTERGKGGRGQKKRKFFQPRERVSRAHMAVSQISIRSSEQ